MTKDQKELRRRILENKGLSKVVGLMTAENLAVRNRRGETVYHLAARAGTIASIPVEHLTSENLTIEDRYQYTPLHRAAYHGHMPKILALVPEVINSRNLRCSGMGGTVFHAAAYGGRLKDVPKHLLTPYNLLLVGPNLNTVLHCIWTFEDFQILGREVFERDNFLIANRNGQTVFHNAASFGTINERAGKLLTSEVMAAKDAHGCTPLLYATVSGCVVHFPVALAADHYDEFRRVYVDQRRSIRKSQGADAVTRWKAEIFEWHVRLARVVLARRASVAVREQIQP